MTTKATDNHSGHTYAAILKEHLAPPSPDHRYYGSCRLVNKSATDARSHGERHLSFQEARASLSRKEFTTLQSVFTRFDEAHTGVLPVILVHKALKDASHTCALKHPGNEAQRWRELLATCNTKTRRRGFFEFDELAVFVSEQPVGIVREPNTDVVVDRFAADTPQEQKQAAKGDVSQAAHESSAHSGIPAPEPEFRLEPVENTGEEPPNCAMWSWFPLSCGACGEEAALRNNDEYSLVFESAPSHGGIAEGPTT